MTTQQSSAPKKPNKAHEEIDEFKHEAEKKIEEVSKMAEEHVCNMVDGVADFVKKNPEKALLISAGVGLALGVALTKALSGKH